MPQVLGTGLLADAFGRVSQAVPDLLAGLTVEQLTWRPDERGNTIAWLVWHLTRVQDDHLAGVAAALGYQPSTQLWDEGWAQRCDVGLATEQLGYGRLGYGQPVEQAHKVVATPEALAGYHAAVAERTSALLDQLTAADYARVVDERWNPPVTAAVRLVSVVNDITQHLGAAAYLRGILP